MSANRQNRDIFAGDDVTLSLVARSPSTNEIFDISGDTLTFRASRIAGEAAALETTGSITSGSAGTFTVALTTALTTDLYGDYEYDVVATAGTTDVTVVTGRLRIRPRNQASDA